MKTEIITRPFVRFLENPETSVSVGLIGFVDWCGDTPVSWKLEPIGGEAPENEWPELLTLLPQRGNTR